MALTSAAIGAGVALRALVSLGAVFTPPNEDPTAAVPDIAAFVACLDPARDIVAHKPASKCTGKVISDAEAKLIRKRRIKRQRTNRTDQTLVVPSKQITGRGTGFFISLGGHILTNWHVIDGCSAASATPAGGEAKVLTVAAGPTWWCFTQNSRRSAARASGAIAIVDYPLHGLTAIKPIYRDGTVIQPALPTRPTSRRYQIHIDVRRGNSGGPVLDAAGLVACVITA